MDIDLVLGWLGWSAVVNFALLVAWFIAFVYAHDAVYRLHGRWFDIPVRQFDAIHYACMGAFKLANLVLFAVPWLALRIVT